MRYEKKVNQEIHSILDRLSAEKRPLVAKWVTQEVCGGHMDGLVEGDDKAFWTMCGYKAVRDMVRRAINRRADDNPDEAKSAQFILPGYNHVHEYYLVNRSGEEQAVHIDNMTGAEIKQKIGLYRSMGSACFDHARELSRYEENRKAATAA